MPKFLDKAGLERVWSKLKTMLNNKANLDLSNASDNALNNIGGALVYTSATTVSSFKRVYLATNGSDSNTGADAAHPMATIKAALKKYSNRFKYIEVYLADGEYTENINTIATDACDISIRSTSQNKEAVTLNCNTSISSMVNSLRLYNMTINMTANNTRPITVNGGLTYLYNVRINVPEGSSSSCLNVYNGSSLFAMNCVLNAPTSGNASAVYTNQGLLVRLVNCTSERTIACGCDATNGGTIEYTPTLTATTESKTSNYGRCVRI